MRVVASLLAVEIHFGVAALEAVVVLIVVLAVPGFEALDGRIRLDQRAIHGEMICTDQPRRDCPTYGVIEEPANQSVLLQAAAVVAEHGGVEYGIVDTQVEKPFVADAFDELRIEYSDWSSKALISRSGGTLGRPSVA